MPRWPYLLFNDRLKQPSSSGVLMKVFGICGSPRAGGTDYAVNYALDILKEKGCETRYFSCPGQGHQILHPLRLLHPGAEGLRPQGRAVTGVLRGHALGGRRGVRHALLPGHAQRADEDDDGPVPGDPREGPAHPEGQGRHGPGGRRRPQRRPGDRAAA